MKGIIEKIKELRYKKGLSQENMAHELKITQPAYAKIESNETSLSVERLISIAKILDTDPIDLFNANSQLHQQNGESTIAYQQKVSHLNQDYPGLYNSLITSLQEEIDLLKQIIHNQNK